MRNDSQQQATSSFLVRLCEPFIITRHRDEEKPEELHKCLAAAVESLACVRASCPPGGARAWADAKSLFLSFFFFYDPTSTLYNTTVTIHSKHDAALPPLPQQRSPTQNWWAFRLDSQGARIPPPAIALLAGGHDVSFARSDLQQARCLFCVGKSCPVRSRATPDWVLIGSKLLNLQHVSSERLSRGERDRRMERDDSVVVGASASSMIHSVIGPPKRRITGGTLDLLGNCCHRGGPCC